MPLVTIARPAPTPAPAPAQDENPDPAVGLAVLKFLLWTATLKPLLTGLALTGMCLYWLANQTYQGRFRYHLRPAWVACLAWYVTPWTPWAWAGTAVGLYLFPTALYLFPSRGSRVSPREQAGLADGACLLAAWQVLAPGFDWPVQASLFLEFTIASLGPWWVSRAWRSEPEVVEVDPILEQWGTDVMESPRAGDLANTEFWRDEQGRYRLRALPGCATDQLTRLGDHVCSLMNRPRGTVTISHYSDDDGDANDFLVAFTDRTDGARVRYATGPTLDEDGTVAVADTADGRTIRVALYTPSGATHFLILATNRYGKGVIMRNIGVELCLWDRAFVIVIDAKGDNDGGSGLPELRGAADIYAWRKADWKAAIHLEHELFQARSSRYSGKAAFWHPNKPVDGYCDPLIAAIKDELRNISKSIGRRELDMLEQISSMGATYGIGEYGDSQKGDAESTFSTAWRNDIRGNGTVFIGRAGDAQAAGIAAQDFNVDLNRLPNGKGWWIVKTSLTHVPLVPARGRLYPTRDEVEFQPGIEAPQGTVEDWLTMTKRAKMHPQDQEIIEKWRPEFEDASTAEPEGDAVAEAVVKGAMDAMASGKLQQTQWFADGDPTWRAWMTAGCPIGEDGAPDLGGVALGGEVVEPAREVVQVADGALVVEAPRRLAVVPDLQPDTKAAIDLIPEVARKAGVMTRGEIAEAVGISPEYASDRLKKLKEMGVMTEARTDDGRPGWRVVA